MPQQVSPLNPQLVADVSRIKSADFEKTIPYMYVDTAAFVTTGVGHNLTVKGDTLKLPFVVHRFERHPVLGGDRGMPITEDKTVGRKATKEEIQNDYDFLAKHAGLGKYAAENLANYTTLELPKTEIDSLFQADVGEAMRVCVSEFGKARFDGYPVSCQAALIDIAFNCGSFVTFRHHLVPAIKGNHGYAKMPMTQRWRVAALHCRRGAISDARNNIVAQWFLAGAAVKSGTTA